MKHWAIVAWIFVCSLMPAAVLGDAEVHEWLGTYDMNHDGHVGMLQIRDTKIDCAAPRWCGYQVRYTNTQGQTFDGRIDKIDDHWQHMVFFIQFPNNDQKFEGYLFSWDKSRMAGVEYWGGRTFGFYAIKR